MRHILTPVGNVTYTSPSLFLEVREVLVVDTLHAPATAL